MYKLGDRSSSLGSFSQPLQAPPSFSSGPAQLFVTCSMEKRGEPGFFSKVRMI